MKELKLLYSYEEWKNKKGQFEEIAEDTARLLSLSFKFDRTEEEEKEYAELTEKSEYKSDCLKYTKLVYTITDMYNELKYTHNDEVRKELYESIGRKQCEVEIMKEELLKNL